MTTKYYLSTDENFLRAVKGANSKGIVLTVKQIAEGLNVSTKTVYNKIKNNEYPLNEISKQRAKEFGVGPISRTNATKFDIFGEQLTIQELTVKYNIPRSTIRLWANRDQLTEKLIMETINSYPNPEVIRSSPSASIWKYTANGLPERVDISNLIYRIGLEEEFDANERYGGQTNTIKHLKKFYNVLENTFKDHVNDGKVMRSIKLCFEKSLPDPKIRNENRVVFNPVDSPLDNEYVYRTVKRCFTITDNDEVKFISFDDFLDKILSFTVNEQYGSDPDNVNAASILDHCVLNPGLFIATVEHSTLIRSNITQMRKNFHCVARKHPYYVLFDANRDAFHNNSCFFDAIRIQMKKHNINVDDKKSDIQKTLKGFAFKYKDGVKFEDIPSLCNALGIKLKIYGDIKSGKGTDIHNVLFESDGKNNEYGDVVFELYLHDNPELHFSALMGVKEKLYYCEYCNTYFNSLIELNSIATNKCMIVSKNHRKGKINEKTKKNQKVFCYYDLETVNDKALMDVEIYSVCWKWSDQSEYNFRLNSMTTKNATYDFYQDINNRMQNEDLDVVLVAYNGGGFDVWGIIKDIAQFINFNRTIFKNSKFYQLGGNHAINFKSTFNIWDPYLFWHCSLESLAKSFGLSILKNPFDHEFMQDKYEENGKSFDWIDEEMKIKIKQYNIRDVEILEQICLKMKDIMGEHVFNSMTISSYSYKHLTEECGFDFIPQSNKDSEKRLVEDESKIITKPDNEEDYKFMRKAITGGRVQTIKNFTKFNDDVFSFIDVVSLYPSVMHINQYPCGYYQKTDTYVPNKLGIYNCKILYQKNPVIIPKKEKDRPLNWFWLGEIEECVLSTVEIDCLRKHFGFDCLEVYDGLYWEHSTDQIFKTHIDKWMKVKKDQDVLKNTGSPEYNNCMRELAKKMLHTPFGKTIQNVIDKGFYVSTSTNYTRKIIQKELKKNDYDFTYLDTGIEFLEGPLKEIKYEYVKPQQLGVFILAYARCKMYEEVFSKTQVYYSDTDSALVLKSELKKLSENGELKIGNGLGEYELEMDDITQFWSVQPKFYQLKNKNGKIKMRLKGISKNSTWKYVIDKEIKIEKKGVDEECFDYIIQDHKNIIFTTGVFKHVKNELALKYVKDFEKNII